MPLFPPLSLCSAHRSLGACEEPLPLFPPSAHRSLGACEEWNRLDFSPSATMGGAARSASRSRAGLRSSPASCHAATPISTSSVCASGLLNASRAVRSARARCASSFASLDAAKLIGGAPRPSCVTVSRREDNQPATTTTRWYSCGAYLCLWRAPFSCRDEG